MFDNRPVTISAWTLVRQDPPYWWTDDDLFPPDAPPALTVEDVRLVLRYAEHGSRGMTGPIPEAIARLRAALPKDQAEEGEEL
jgi:hypothetical protein